MRCDKLTVNNLFAHQAQYEIQPLQRHYVWDKPNWQRLWDDIVETMEDANPSAQHYLGAIMVTPQALQPGNIEIKNVIDGQQRLITLSILLAALRDACRESVNGQSIADEINHVFLVHPFRKGRDRFKVYPKNRGAADYFSIINDGHPLNPKSRFAKAYAFFRHVIGSEDMFTGIERLERLRTAITDSLVLIVITAEDQNAYRIFQSMNSTGQPLTQSDLIRTYVFSGVPLDQQNAFDDGPWASLEHHFVQATRRRGRKSKNADQNEHRELNSDALDAFFRDYLMMTEGLVPERSIYEVFRAKHSLASLSNGGAMRLVKRLTHLAGLYNIIRGTAPDPSPRLTLAFQNLQGQVYTSSAPVLLRLMEAVRPQSGPSMLTEDRLEHAINALAGFYFRRLVAGERSKDYVKWFAQGCKDMANWRDPVDGLMQFLTDKGWPSDLMFRERFVHFKLYKLGVPAKTALAAIAGLTSEEAATLEMEHIMPQEIEGTSWESYLGENTPALHDALCHTAGNLALIDRSDNAGLRNGAFFEKKAVLASYHCRTTDMFRDPSLAQWGVQEIEGRGRDMGRIAEGIWMGPPTGMQAAPVSQTTETSRNSDNLKLA